MSGEQTRRASGRVARFQAWARAVRPRGRKLSADRFGRSVAHNLSVGLGFLVVIFGVFYLIVAGGYYTPTGLVLMVVGVVLVLIGLAEVGVEEGRRRSRD
jgi:type IV secretory pathway VirB6-like protein